MILGSFTPIFILGMRSVPPARMAASSPYRARWERSSSRLFGLIYSKFGRDVMIHPEVALIRLLDVLPNLYQAVFYYFLWVTYDITLSDFCNVLGDAVVKR